MRQVSRDKIKGSKKNRLAYSCGILFLVAALLCAFYLPEYVSRWQDEQLLGQVHVEERQEVHLPEKSNIIGEKIHRISESGYFEKAVDFAIQEKTDEELMIVCIGDFGEVAEQGGGMGLCKFFFDGRIPGGSVVFAGTGKCIAETF